MVFTVITLQLVFRFQIRSSGGRLNELVNLSLASKHLRFEQKRLRLRTLQPSSVWKSYSPRGPIEIAKRADIFFPDSWNQAYQVFAAGCTKKFTISLLPRQSLLLKAAQTMFFSRLKKKNHTHTLNYVKSLIRLLTNMSLPMKSRLFLERILVPLKFDLYFSYNCSLRGTANSVDGTRFLPAKTACWSTITLIQ